AYLKEKGFEAKSAEGESMEICFIEGDYRDFLRQQIPDIDDRIGKGKFVDAAGHTLGVHQGFPFYTIGQRKGLGVALGKPAYVIKLNPAKNTVMLGDADELKAEYMLTEAPVWVNETEDLKGKGLTVRIRYRSQPIPCEVTSLDDGRLLVYFLGEASAVTPGQSAVFYIGNRVVGGAFIASQRGIGMFCG
ncbi:MAG: tRNA 2-thiouridine(34) synthase MnmA, partial [Bacteroidaceae bacterium]|nr:tRNA 2-thiouridine(34) synthase MnmA [Bacteroidaceae bacterium]